MYAAQPGVRVACVSRSDQTCEITSLFDCRGAVSELSAADELPLCEDAAGVRLLIEGMYNAYMAVTAGVVEPLLELSRKCDVEDIKLNCERFLNAVPLTLESLPRYMALACTFDIKSAVDRCKDYIDSDDHFVLLKG